MLRIAIGHDALGIGGSEALVLWGLTALRGMGELTLLTAAPVELDRLNRHYGTDLRPGDFRVSMAPRWRNRLLGHGGALRRGLFQRHVLEVARHFDLCISGYNFTDFGKPALQFVGDFLFDDALRGEFDPSPPGARSLVYDRPLIRRSYLAFTRWVGGRSGYAGADDWIIANSRWTAEVLRARRGIACRGVLYPPVVCPPAAVPWEQRDDTFVCLGRVSHEKRIERVIEIVRRVRARGHDVNLVVVGPVGHDAYGQLIARLARESGGWCRAVGGKSGHDKFNLLSRCRWALHGRRGEAFGIAVAEQVLSGCLPFVPDDAGPAEIVGDPALCYHDETDAVEKIDAVLRDRHRQARLRAHLAMQADRFGTRVFVPAFRRLVEDFARGRGLLPR